MEWYYAEEGRQLGPVTEEQFQELVRSGKITGTTLVWQQGMAKWQPYNSVSVTEAVPGSPGDTARCAECGKIFSTNDMVHYGNSWVCAACKPVFFQRVTEGAPPPASMALWRSDRLLVMNKDATLPDRCVKCNAPANGKRLTRNLYWHSPYIYLLILLNLIIYVIVALIVRKKARVQIGLCDQHRTKRRLALSFGWLAGLGGLGLFIVSLANSWGLLALVGFGLLLAGLIVGATGSMISAKRIDDRFVWVKGVCRPYLDSLPEWREGF